MSSKRWTAATLVTESEVQRRKAEAQVKAAWRELLGRYRWDSFVTLTASSWTPAALLRGFKKYVRHLTQVVQGRVRYFVVVEVGPSGTPHLHALLAGTAGIDPELLERKWRPGLSKAERFDERRGAAAYITKDIMRDADDYFFSEKMPPLREADVPTGGRRLIWVNTKGRSEGGP